MNLTQITQNYDTLSPLHMEQIFGICFDHSERSPLKV